MRRRRRYNWLFYVISLVFPDYFCDCILCQKKGNQIESMLNGYIVAHISLAANITQQPNWRLFNSAPTALVSSAKKWKVFFSCVSIIHFNYATGRWHGNMLKRLLFEHFVALLLILIDSFGDEFFMEIVGIFCHFESTRRKRESIRMRRVNSYTDSNRD